MKYLFVLNDPPYGTERSYNGLRMARELLTSGNGDNQVRVFLVADAVFCAKQGQTVPKGYYHIESFIGMLIRHQAEVGVCGSCMEARAMGEDELIEGCHRSSMAEFAEWSDWADKVMVF